MDAVEPPREARAQAREPLFFDLPNQNLLDRHFAEIFPARYVPDGPRNARFSFWLDNLPDSPSPPVFPFGAVGEELSAVRRNDTDSAGEANFSLSEMFQRLLAPLQEEKSAFGARRNGTNRRGRLENVPTYELQLRDQNNNLVINPLLVEAFAQEQRDESRAQEARRHERLRAQLVENARRPKERHHVLERFIRLPNHHDEVWNQHDQQYVPRHDLQPIIDGYLRQHSEHPDELCPPRFDFGTSDITSFQMQVAVLLFQEFRQSAPILSGAACRNMPLCCGFCYGTAQTFAQTHGYEVPDKDSWGPWSDHKLKTGNVTTCPVLRRQHCEICGATGDQAHTTHYHRQMCGAR